MSASPSRLSSSAIGTKRRWITSHLDLQALVGDGSEAIGLEQRIRVVDAGERERMTHLRARPVVHLQHLAPNQGAGALRAVHKTHFDVFVT